MRCENITKRKCVLEKNIQFTAKHFVKRLIAVQASYFTI